MYDTFAGFDRITKFEPQDGHHYVEAFEDNTEEMPRLVFGTLRHEEICPWLSQPRAAKLRVLITKPRENAKPGRRSYPLALDTFYKIVSTFGIPKAFVNLAASQTTGTFELSAHDNVGNEQLPVILAVLGSHGLAVTFDPLNNTTYGLMLNVCQHQVQMLLETVRVRANQLFLPMSLTIIWLNVHGQTRARRVIGRKDGICRSDVDIGIHWSKETQAMKKRLQDLDFREITRRLTVLGSEACWDAHAVGAQLELASACERVHAILSEYTNRASSESAEDAFTSHLRHAKQMLQGLRAWTIDTQQRAQVQLQTVYSLVSQRDNEISFATSVTSQKIAEASQRDGALMKQLAEDSRKIAVQSWRDGVDMRIMAAVTLLTLPGTFTATLFSTSFFNFQPTESSKVVSHWVWLYFAITAALTLAFAMAWYTINRAVVRRFYRSLESENSGFTDSAHTDCWGARDPVPVVGMKRQHARLSSQENIPEPVLLPQRDETITQGFGSELKTDDLDVPIKSHTPESKGIQFHSLADAMTPELFGKACAICGAPEP